MIYIHQTIDVPYAQETMYALVNDIESYPEFIPFCTVGAIEATGEKTTKGTLTFAWLGIVQSFVTYNVLTPPNAINMTLAEGPFKHLEGGWKFEPLSSDKTRVTFNLSFKFGLSNAWFDVMLQPVFNTLSKNAVQVFINRAHELELNSDVKTKE